MLLADVAATSAAVAATTGRLAKVDLLAALLRQAGPEEVPIAVSYLSGELPQGAVGVGWAALRNQPPPVEGAPRAELMTVNAALRRIQAAAGPGSNSARRETLATLLAALTPPERQFLTGLLSGGLRQGALAGVMVEAVAAASHVAARQIRRAVLVSGDLPAVAAAALSGGPDAVAAFGLQVLHPFQPMLAQSAAGPEEALQRLTPGGPRGRGGSVGRVGIEWKIDGVRVQVHRSATEVRVFTRNLADVTDRVPEVVEAVAALPATSLVLDGELIALRPDGSPRRFQETMGRFGNRGPVASVRAAMPLTPFFFDCLHLEGEDLLDQPAGQRFAALASAVPAGLLVPRAEVADAPAAGAFLDAALAAGHEGIMAKSLSAPYEAGRRGAGWLKVKRAHTLDLVVLAAEWGHGRRRGFLSNLHLGARDPAGGFVMLGKTFKGMTDSMLAWQTDHLSALETHREGAIVTVRPELVVEVAFDGVQESSRYPGGMALRFARIKGYRPEKDSREADTIDAVRAIFEAGRQ